MPIYFGVLIENKLFCTHMQHEISRLAQSLFTFSLKNHLYIMVESNFEFAKCPMYSRNKYLSLQKNSTIVGSLLLAASLKLLVTWRFFLC